MVSRMPAGRLRWNVDRCVSLAARAILRARQPCPAQVTVIRTPLGAVTVSDVTLAPVSERRPRTRTFGTGLIILARLLAAVWCSTSPALGTGVETGTAATSKVGAGVGVGV